ncbi:hypothetical protein B0H16DRAFT_1527938 [Mycena metata]|uniref:DUF6535 domain-containing protein n=1 Tax=Mycena metata TaxID=1033252 RepID=A0AAD7NJW2_9AGAR|nr:hypothetical protein B0H16DRAFT_1527938 [Mycena metata]
MSDAASPPPVTALNIQTSARALRDSRRFTDAIETFTRSSVEHSDRLLVAINEQSTTFSTALEKLINTVEKMRPDPPSTDNKTVFWTAYKTLADEYDKDIQRKYGNDLDTTLIFAGLFSAVSSAFIIQIQPELQPASLVQNITSMAISNAPPTIIVVAQSFLYFSLFSTLLAALLAVLGKQWLLQYDSVGERGTIAERGLERQHKFDGMQHWKFDLAMQIFPLLLQFSLLLFAVGLSTYLWTINRAIAGLVLSLTVLGCIGYGAMVASAMRSADSPFQTPLTSLLGLLLAQSTVATSWICLPNWLCNWWNAILDHISHLMPVQSISSESSTSTNVSDVQSHQHDPDLSHMIESQPFLFFPSLRRFLRRSHFIKRIKTMLADFWHFLAHTRILCIGTVISGRTPTLVPDVLLSTLIFEDIQQPSPEISAVVWVLETTTDPTMVQSAAALVPELQWWPLHLDLAPSKQRLADIFDSCCSGDNIPTNMEFRASVCTKAIVQLNLVGASENNHLLKPHLSQDNELNSLLQTFDIMSLDWESFTPTHLTLRALSAYKLSKDHLSGFIDSIIENGAASVKDKAAFAELLFCLNTFFLPTLPCDRSIADKSPYIIQLTTHLFRNLIKDAIETPQLSMLIISLADLACGKNYYELPYLAQVEYTPLVVNFMDAVYKFCVARAPHVPAWAIASTLELVRLLDIQALPKVDDDFSWLYNTLEDIDQSDKRYIGHLERLLGVLLSAQSTPKPPKPHVLRTLLRVLAPSAQLTDSEWYNVRSLISKVLCWHYSWFLDRDLGPLLQKPSVWANLGGFSHVKEYLALGEKLSGTPEWKQLISQDLPTWLAQLPRLSSSGRMNADVYRQMFVNTLQRVWNADQKAAEKFGTGNLKTLAMIYMAFTNVWNRFDAVNPAGSHQWPKSRLIHWHRSHLLRVLDLLERTVAVAFCPINEYEVNCHPSQDMKDSIMMELAAALTQAGERVRQEGGNKLRNSVENSIGDMGDLISKVGSVLYHELQQDPLAAMGGQVREMRRWKGIWHSIVADIATMRTTLEFKM